MRTPDDQFSFLRSNENWNGNRASSRTFSLTRTNEEARSLLRGHAPHVCCIKRSGNLLLRDVTYVRATCAKYHLDPIPSTLNFSFSLLFFFCSFFFFFVRFAKEVCARARHRCIRLRVMGEPRSFLGDGYEWEIWSKNAPLDGDKSFGYWKYKRQLAGRERWIYEYIQLRDAWFMTRACCLNSATFCAGLTPLTVCVFCNRF